MMDGVMSRETHHSSRCSRCVLSGRVHHPAGCLVSGAGGGRCLISKGVKCLISTGGSRLIRWKGGHTAVADVWNIMRHTIAVVVLFKRRLPSVARCDGEVAHSSGRCLKLGEAHHCGLCLVRMEARLV